MAVKKAGGSPGTEVARTAARRQRAAKKAGGAEGSTGELAKAGTDKAANQVWKTGATTTSLAQGREADFGEHVASPAALQRLTGLLEASGSSRLLTSEDLPAEGMPMVGVMNPGPYAGAAPEGEVRATPSVRDLLGVERENDAAPQYGGLKRFFQDKAAGSSMASGTAPSGTSNGERLARAIDTSHLLVIDGSKTVTEVREEVDQLAKAANVHVRHVDLSHATGSYDFLGRWEATADGGVAFRDGPVAEALRKGEWLVVTGLERAHPDVRHRLGLLDQQTFEGQHYMSLVEANGEVVPFHGAGRVIAVVKGDGEAAYSGRERSPVARDLTFWQPLKWQSPPEARPDGTWSTGSSGTDHHFFSRPGQTRPEPDSVQERYTQANRAVMQKNVRHLESALQLDHKVLVYNAGTGAETRTAIEALAAAKQARLTVIDGAKVTSVLDLMGRWEDDGKGGARWEDGPLTQAVKRGEWIAIENYDALPSQVVERLALTQNRTSMWRPEDTPHMPLPEHRGEDIPIHSEARMIVLQRSSKFDGRPQFAERALGDWVRTNWDYPPFPNAGTSAAGPETSKPE